MFSKYMTIDIEGFSNISMWKVYMGVTVILWNSEQIQWNIDGTHTLEAGFFVRLDKIGLLDSTKSLGTLVSK